MLTEQAWALIRVTQTSGPGVWRAVLYRKVAEDGRELSRLKNRSPGLRPQRVHLSSLVFVLRSLSLNAYVFLSLSQF